QPELRAGDLARALATTRTHHSHRAVVVGQDIDELQAGLAALARGEEHPDVVRGTAAAQPGKTVFVFPGQGSQYPGMARELLDTSQVFRDHITACETALAPHTDWSLTHVLTQHPDAPTLDRLDVLQPTLFAVLTGLAEIWKTHGIHPDAVIGHSQGEIAAAYTTGALTLTDATTIIALRSKLLANLTTTGALLHAPLTPRQLQPHLNQHLTIAATNSPRSTIIAGTHTHLEQLATTLNDHGTKTRLITATVPSHSPHVEPLHHQLLQDLHNINPQPTTTPFISTITAQPHDTTTLDPEYWYQNMRQPVRFHEATQNLLDTGHTLFIEISPHPVLTTALTQTTDHHTTTNTPTNPT
ncbi:acyltransferase domain-containing protein, partial [Streptomyces malaysiense]|uniref:acyltransferase domain-containing protein n=1 Tax=Streptomyces malaysiense TaxID=1428626 RepID=UPI001160A7CF